MTDANSLTTGRELYQAKNGKPMASKDDPQNANPPEPGTLAAGARLYQSKHTK